MNASRLPNLEPRFGLTPIRHRPAPRETSTASDREPSAVLEPIRNYLAGVALNLLEAAIVLAVQVHADRADLLDVIKPVGLFDELPGLFTVDVLIGTVGERHDFPHGPGILTTLIGRGNTFSGCLDFIEQGFIMQAG